MAERWAHSYSAPLSTESSVTLLLIKKTRGSTMGPHDRARALGDQLTRLKLSRALRMGAVRRAARTAPWGSPFLAGAADGSWVKTLRARTRVCFFYSAPNAQGAHACLLFFTQLRTLRARTRVCFLTQLRTPRAPTQLRQLGGVIIMVIPTCKTSQHARPRSQSRFLRRVPSGMAWPWTFHAPVA